MIEFIDTELMQCFAAGFLAGAVVASTIMGIRAVVRIVMRMIRKA